MQPSSDQLQASVVLRLNMVEVYQVLDKKHTLQAKGPLQVLHLSSHKCFIMRVQDFNYHLSKEIPIVACPSNEGLGLPSYVFPNVDGYFIMKIIHVTSYEGLSSLESIFNNHTNFSYQEKEQAKGYAPIGDGKKEEEKKDDRTGAEIASDIIYKGGEMTKAGLIKGAQFISLGIGKLGDFINDKYIKSAKEEADLRESTVNKVEIANTATGALVMITKVQADGIVLVGKAIGKEVARKMEKTETGQKIQNYEHQGAVKQIGKSTLNFAANWFVGMAEAVAIIGKGVGDTTTKIIDKKYGHKAGETTKTGFETAGNILEIPKIIPMKIVQAIESGTAKGPKDENCKKQP